MTSLAFFFGVLPLAIATGAGAGAMKAIGTAVAGGMLTATVIAIFFIPLLFLIVSRLFSRRGHNAAADGTADPRSPGRDGSYDKKRPF